MQPTSESERHREPRVAVRDVVPERVVVNGRYSRPVDKSTGLGSDQTVMLTVAASAKDFPDPLRRVRYTDPETGKRLSFLSNHMGLSALVVANMYKARWRVELFLHHIICQK